MCLLPLRVRIALALRTAASCPAAAGTAVIHVPPVHATSPALAWPHSLASAHHAGCPGRSAAVCQTRADPGQPVCSIAAQHDTTQHNMQQGQHKEGCGVCSFTLLARGLDLEPLHCLRAHGRAAHPSVHLKPCVLQTVRHVPRCGLAKHAMGQQHATCWCCAAGSCRWEGKSCEQDCVGVGGCCCCCTGTDCMVLVLALPQQYPGLVWWCGQCCHHSRSSCCCCCCCSDWITSACHLLLCYTRTR